MKEAITIDLVAMVGTAIAAIAVVWFRIEGKIALAQSELEARIATEEARTAKLRQDLADHKLEVVRDYASVIHLKEVEGRLVTAINRLTDKIEERWPIIEQAVAHSVRPGPRRKKPGG